MDPIKNKFKQRLLNKELMLGLWCCLGNNQAAEIISCVEYDWVVLEGEHSPNYLQDFLHLLHATSSYNIDPIVRPPSDDPVFIKQVLELGAQTLLIPVVETKEQAENIVKATRYPPEGIRGMGSIMARSGRWGSIDNYPANANEEICVIAMIETTKGLQNLEEILTVDGIDAVFFGPNDLSAHLGVIDKVLDPIVVNAIKDGIQKANNANKASGVLTVNLEMVREYAELGATIIGIGLDTLVLLNGSRNLLMRAKGRLSKLI